MQLYPRALFALLLLTCLCPAQGRRRRPEPKPLEHLTWQTRSFESEALGGEIQYGCLAPKDLKEGETLPLVLWLHGMRKDHTEFHRRGGAGVVDKMVGSGAIPRAIFVTANGRRSFYTNGFQGGRWEDMVRKDLVAEAVANLQANKDPRLHGIMGISMGGMGALKIAMKHPEEFAAVATHSAAVFPEDPAELSGRLQQAVKWLGLDAVYGDPIDPKIWARENPLNLARKLEPEKVGKLGIFFDAGTTDRYRFHRSNALLSDALKAKKVTHTFKMREGHGHSWGSGFRLSSLEESLKFVGQRLSANASAEAGRKGLAGLLGGEADEPGKDEGSGGEGKQQEDSNPNGGSNGGGSTGGGSQGGGGSK